MSKPTIEWPRETIDMVPCGPILLCMGCGLAGPTVEHLQLNRLGNAIAGPGGVARTSALASASYYG